MVEEKAGMVMARACIRCREYVHIKSDDSENQEVIKAFEKSHSGHNLVTLEFIEIKNQYTEFKTNK